VWIIAPILPRPWQNGPNQTTVVTSPWQRALGGICCPDQAPVCDVNTMALRSCKRGLWCVNNSSPKCSQWDRPSPTGRVDYRQAFKIGAPHVGQAGISSAAESLGIATEPPFSNRRSLNSVVVSVPLLFKAAEHRVQRFVTPFLMKASRKELQRRMVRCTFSRRRQ
jgi:hypothetical protein